jgi:hypothetical protein
LKNEQSNTVSELIGILEKMRTTPDGDGSLLDHSMLMIGGGMSNGNIHSHMDEETFDVERVAQCCDSNCYADGSTVPVCSYNVLYREKEAHFMLEPRAWQDRSGGDKSLRRSLPIVRS